MSSVDKIVINLPTFASVAAQIAVKSSAFENGAAIPDRNSAYHDDISPALSWSNVPAEAKSVVLIVQDPDAPKPEPFVHWLVMNLPPDAAASLPENQPRTEKLDAKLGANLDANFGKAQQGANGFGGVGYLGPKPPPGHGVHHYHFQVFALDVAKIDLIADFAFAELLEAMKNHVIAKGELVGTYERQAE